MYERQERPRGVMLTMLNVEPVAALAMERALADDEIEKKPTSCSPYAPYGIAEGVDGKLYAVNTEGVGREVSDEKPLVLPLYLHGEGWFAMAPNYEVTLTPEQVRELADGGDEVDLADHVREFGDRLEVNFGIWHRTLTGEGVANR